MLIALAVAGGAALGAPCRYLVDRAIQGRHRQRFPLGTLLINWLGSAVLGLLVGLVAGAGLSTTAFVYELALTVGHELQALIEEVAIPESWFFRDSRPFEILATFARSGWVERPDRKPLTVLSVPCAGGEEPYSIAMTLLEAGLPLERFRVDAVDVSERSLARAIAGSLQRRTPSGGSSEPGPGQALPGGAERPASRSTQALRARPSGSTWATCSIRPCF